LKEIMNTQLAKHNRFGETSDPGISAEIAGHAIVSGPLRSEETLSTLAWALVPDGAMCRISPHPFPSATYFPELLSTLAGQALTAHWDYPARQ
jgi:hypothetical protein